MKVLLAVDGSQKSYEAAELLHHFVCPNHLIVLNVVDIPDLDYQSLRLRIGDLPGMLEQEMRRESRNTLEQATSRLPADISSISSQVETGNPAEIILNIAAESKIDLIVLGARGLNRLSELILGSVSHRVMTHATCSTCIVKSPIPSLRHILLPIAGAEDGKRALAFFKNVPFRASPVITVMHVVPFHEHYWMEGALLPPSIREELVGAGKVLTEQVVSQLAEMGYEAESVVRYGLPADLIQATVVEKHPDLVVVGSHSRTGVTRFFLGSVSHSVVHRTPGSVLIIR